MESIYLDNNATTKLLPDVGEAMREAFAAGHANPASQHEPGRRARRVVEACRERIAELLGARVGGVDADRVIFTSGGTEANNLAIRGLAPAARASAGAGDGNAPRDLPRNGQLPRGGVAISAIEHPSVAAAADHLRETGWTVDRLAVDRDGVARLDGLRDLLRPHTQLVSVMLGSNETGVLQPVREIAAVCREAGVACHTDAVQAVGKAPVSFRELGVDALTCTAHKLNGPRGIGALLVRRGVPLAPILHGGFQQGGLRPGTESVELVVGFCHALELWHRHQESWRARLAALRDRFEAAILGGYPAAKVLGQDAPRLPHTSNIAFVGLDRQALQMALDLAGVACSTGSACASGSSEPSPVLAAMGCPPDIIGSSLRFSLGVLSSEPDVEEAVRRILLTCSRLRKA